MFLCSTFTLLIIVAIILLQNRPKGPPRRPPSNLANLRSRTEEPEAPSSSSMYSSVNFRPSFNQQPASKSLRLASSAAAIGAGSSSRSSRDAPRSGSNIAPTDGVVIRPTNESSKPGSGASNRLGRTCYKFLILKLELFRFRYQIIP